MKKTKLLSLFLALGLILSGCSAEDSKDSSSSDDSSQDGSSLFGNMFGSSDDSTSADEMRLENYTGNITLQNNSEEKAVVLGSRLVTGDNIETMTESNAYVVLDQSKVLRVNETSQVEIIQEEKHLDIYLSKGTLFFNVTTTLSEEETLDFHTNNVVTGVRGTSGIIHFDSVAQVTQIVVLTGVVTGTTTSEEQNIEAGQVAVVETLPDGTVEMTIYELEENDPLYYFSDTFIDGIQGDLNGEGQSLPLSEMVREPEGILLADNIQVIGELRYLSHSQASGFAEVLRSVQTRETPPSHVTFVDEDGTLLMVMWDQATYDQYVEASKTVDLHYPNLLEVVGWTGTEVHHDEEKKLEMIVKYNGVLSVFSYFVVWDGTAPEFCYYQAFENGVLQEHSYEHLVNAYVYEGRFSNEESYVYPSGLNYIKENAILGQHYNAALSTGFSFQGSNQGIRVTVDGVEPIDNFHERYQSQEVLVSSDTQLTAENGWNTLDDVLSALES